MSKHIATAIAVTYFIVSLSWITVFSSERTVWLAFVEWFTYSWMLAAVSLAAFGVWGFIVGVSGKE